MIINCSIRQFERIPFSGFIKPCSCIFPQRFGSSWLMMENSLHVSAPYPPLLFPSFPSQRAVAASTSLPRRTSSARAVRRTASTTARARGAATARTATTEPSPTFRLWPAQVSPPLLRWLISYIHLSHSMRFLQPELFSHGWGGAALESSRCVP